MFEQATLSSANAGRRAWTTGLAWIFAANSQLTFWAVSGRDDYRNWMCSGSRCHHGMGVDFSLKPAAINRGL